MLSNDSRERVIKAYENGHSVKDIAEIFSVHISTVYRLIHRKEESGSVEARTYLCGRKPILSEQEVEQIDQTIAAQPDLTIHEINEKLSLPCSDETVRQRSLDLGYRYKKKSMHAGERRRVRCGGEAGGVESTNAAVRSR